MYEYMYVYLSIYVCLCIYVYTFIYVCFFTYVYIFIYNRPFIVMERLRDLSGILNINFQETQPKFLQRKSFSFVEMLHLAKDLAISLR
jgi:hypothetical protein